MSKYKRKIPLEDWEQIIERLKNVETYQSIADSYGVSRELIRQYACRANLHGYGLKKRSETKYKQWLIDMKSKYGHHFDGASITDKDFLSVCLQKYTAKKANAKRSGILFTEEFSNIIWNKTCPILNIELNYFAEGRQENSPSFDCIDHKLGYISGNVQVISWRANRIKNNGTAEEHLLIYHHMMKLENK